MWLETCLDWDFSFDVRCWCHELKVELVVCELWCSKEERHFVFATVAVAVTCGKMPALVPHDRDTMHASAKTWLRGHPNTMASEVHRIRRLVEPGARNAYSVLTMVAAKSRLGTLGGAVPEPCCLCGEGTHAYCESCRLEDGAPFPVCTTCDGIPQWAWRVHRVEATIADWCRGSSSLGWSWRWWIDLCPGSDGRSQRHGLKTYGNYMDLSW